MNRICKTLFFFMIIMLLSACNQESESSLNKFLGTYSVYDLCDSDETNYFLTITVKDEQNNEIYIDNFGGYDSKLFAHIERDSVFINDYADNLHIVGSGYINANRTQIDFTYSVSNNNITENCISIAVK